MAEQGHKDCILGQTLLGAVKNRKLCGAMSIHILKGHGAWGVASVANSKSLENSGLGYIISKANKITLL